MTKKGSFFFGRFSILFVLVLMFLAFVACGDDESEDFLSPRDVEELDSSSSIKGKSSSSIRGQSSSSESEKGSSANGSSEGGSNGNEDRDDKGSGNSSCNDCTVSSSSSSYLEDVEQSSSSYVCVDTVSNIPSMLYDCDVYDCVPTGHLNPKVDYGELLDERDFKVYRTIEVGGRTWMAQNLAYNCSRGEDVCRQYGGIYGGGYNPCPEGWEVPSMNDYDSLFKVFGKTTLRDMRARSCLWKPYREDDVMDWTDSLGFSLLPSGLSQQGGGYLGCATYLWTSTPTKFGYENFVTSSCKSFLASRDYASNGFAIRCIKSREIEYLDVADCRKDPTKCVFGTLEDARDGQTYKTAKYGRMEWMAENLNYEYVPENEDDRGFSGCYNDSKDSCAKYGRLYNMTAAGVSSGQDSTGAFVRGICPEGWHVPSADEWALLKRSFGTDELLAESPVGFDLYYSGHGSLRDGSSYYGWGDFAGFWTTTKNLRGDHRSVVIDRSSLRKPVLYLDEDDVYWSDLLNVRCLKDYDRSKK